MDAALQVLRHLPLPEISNATSIFLECTLSSFGMLFFLPTQSMDVDATGIL